MTFRTAALLLIGGAALACGGDAESATARGDDPAAAPGPASEYVDEGPATGPEPEPTPVPAADDSRADGDDPARPGADDGTAPGPGSTSGADEEPRTPGPAAAGDDGTAAAPEPAPRARTPDAPADTLPSPEAVLERTARAYEGLTSLRAGFDQELQNRLLGRTIRSEGILYQRQPDRFLMEFTDPAGDLIVSDGEWFWMYFPSVDGKQVIRTPRGGQGLDLRAQFIGDPVRRFEATDHGVETVRGRPARVLTLDPRQPLGYERLKVWIDRADGLVRRFELTESNGNVRHFELYDLERNPALADSIFEFTPPPGAQVVTR